MKKSVAIIMVLLICVSGVPAPVSADTGESKTYSAHSDVMYDANTGEVSVTTKVTLSSPSESKVNWELNWFLPGNAEIKLVSAEHGSVHFTEDHGRINIQRDSGEPTTSEVFTIKYTYQNEGSSLVPYVKTVGFSFSEQEPKWSSNSVEFTLKNGSIKTINTPSAIEWKNNSTVLMKSDRGVRFSIHSSPASAPEPVVETDDYVVYGETNLSDSEIKSAYNTAKKVTGMKPESKIPVVFFSPENKGGLSNMPKGSAGLYERGIVYVDSKYDASYEYSILAHEFQHAYNDHLIGVTPQWFNEGTAELTASRASHATGSGQKGVKYIETIDSIDSQEAVPVFSDFSGNGDSFGYYYSELIFKSFVQSKGLDAYQSAYASLANSTEEQYRVTNEHIEDSDFSMTPVCTGSNTANCVKSTMEFVPAQSANISGSAPTVTTTDTGTPTITEQSSTTPTTSSSSGDAVGNGMPLKSYTQISFVILGLLVVVSLRVLR